MIDQADELTSEPDVVAATTGVTKKSSALAMMPLK
jgi:hypothetical protein